MSLDYAKRRAFVNLINEQHPEDFSQKKILF